MIENFANYFVYELLGLNSSLSYAKAIHFFIYDTIKISFLLVAIIFFMGVINSYFPVQKVRTFLARKKLYGLGNFLAALLGAMTPFCSCSSIPLFIGFLKGGIPLGITLSFLITSPLVNEVAIAVFWSVFGIKITISYAISGILVGTFVGAFLGKMRLEPLLEKWVQEQIAQGDQSHSGLEEITFNERVASIRNEAWETFKRVFPYVLIGITIGALIHGFIPTGYFESYIGKKNLFAVPAATILAVPMYANVTGVIPVIESLVDKGIPLGTALAFMMGVVGLSLPEGILLKKVMTLKLIFIYFGCVALSIMGIGYCFNFFF